MGSSAKIFPRRLSSIDLFFVIIDGEREEKSGTRRESVMERESKSARYLGGVVPFYTRKVSRAAFELARQAAKKRANVSLRKKMSELLYVKIRRSVPRKKSGSLSEFPDKIFYLI